MPGRDRAVGIAALVGEAAGERGAARRKRRGGRLIRQGRNGERAARRVREPRRRRPQRIAVARLVDAQARERRDAVHCVDRRSARKRPAIGSRLQREPDRARKPCTTCSEPSSAATCTGGVIVAQASVVCCGSWVNPRCVGGGGGGGGPGVMWNATLVSTGAALPNAAVRV